MVTDEDRIDLHCDCSCTVLSLTTFGIGQELWAEFYTQVRDDTRLLYRLKMAWQVLRGKDHYLDALVISPDQIGELSAFLAKKSHERTE